jgi:hypothetical protein
MPLEITERAGAVEFAVKAVPGASRDALSGLWGTALKVKVAAPPEGGRANDAIVALLAAALGVRAAAVSIISGQTHPVKRIRVAGLKSEQTRQRLDPGSTPQSR